MRLEQYWESLLLPKLFLSFLLFSNGFQETPQHLPSHTLLPANDDGDKASLHQFPKPLLPLSSGKYRFAELDASDLQQCSGKNRIQFFRHVFSNAIDKILLRLLFPYNSKYNHAFDENKNDSVPLQAAPQTFYWAESHVSYNFLPYL